MIFVPASSATNSFAIARSMSTCHLEKFYGADQDAVKPFRDALMVRMAVIGNHLLSNAPLTPLPPLVLDAINITVANVEGIDWQLSLVTSNEKQHRWNGQAIRRKVYFKRRDSQQYFKLAYYHNAKRWPSAMWSRCRMQSTQWQDQYLKATASLVLRVVLNGESLVCFADANWRTIPIQKLTHLSGSLSWR